MTTTDTPTLDDAWAAAEAALPEGWRLWEANHRYHCGGSSCADRLIEHYQRRAALHPESQEEPR